MGILWVRAGCTGQPAPQPRRISPGVSGTSAGGAFQRADARWAEPESQDRGQRGDTSDTKAESTEVGRCRPGSPRTLLGLLTRV